MGINGIFYEIIYLICLLCVVCGTWRLAILHPPVRETVYANLRQNLIFQFGALFWHLRARGETPPPDRSRIAIVNSDSTARKYGFNLVSVQG